MATHLKLLLQHRHLQAHPAFCREYDRVAGQIDPELVDTWPSRATLHRWMTGDVKRRPYPHHCRVLEEMFHGWTIDQLLQICPDDQPSPSPSEALMAQLMGAVRNGLAAPPPAVGRWLVPSQPPIDHVGAIATMPPALSDHIASDNGDPAPLLGRRLVALQQRLRLSDTDTQALARLSGAVVELTLSVSVTIEPNGDAVVSYEHDILNLTPMPLRRLPRELWFKHAGTGHLKITPITMDGRRIMIQRTHDTTSMSKFACQFAPAVEPGEAAHFGYSCLGGRFVDEFYWRQDVVRPTRHLTISARHRRAALLRCAAVEQLPDGSEAFATEHILWDHEGPDATMTVTRDYLSPGQALTLRWEIEA